MFPNENTNRSKSVEFAMFGVVHSFVTFSAVAIFGYADFKIYLKKVSTKINLHTWIIRI